MTKSDGHTINFQKEEANGNMPGFTPSIKVSKKDIEAQLYSQCCDALMFVANGDGRGDHIVHWYECTQCRRPSSPKECDESN